MATELKGFQFPIFKNSLGFFFSQKGNDTIKGDLIQLILTNPGERVMLPQFGTPLRKYIYEPNVEVVKNSIKKEISNAIQKWEPRITIKSIDVTNLQETSNGITQTNMNGVLVKINYINPEKINIIENLVLAIPFEGG